MQALWMLLAALAFASMAVCVKIASAWFNPAEVIFYRGLLGMVIIWAWARSRRESLATPYFGAHAWRSLMGVFALGTWFYAIAHLPLATAMTLNYMSSVWIAAFLVGGAVIAWQRPSSAGPAALTGLRDVFLRQGPLALTVLAGFAGVVIMLRPTIDQNQAFAGMVGLVSGLASAFAYLQVMALGKLGEPESRTVFYFAAGATVAGGLAMLALGTSPWDWAHAVWLLPVGLFASLGQLCMTRAYSKGATLVVANLQYSGIVFGALYSVLLFGDQIPLIGWAGMGLIVVSGIAATALRARAAPGAPAEEH